MCIFLFLFSGPHSPMETDWSVVSRQHSLTSVGRLYSPRFLLTVRPKLFKFGQILWSLTSPSSLLQEGEPSSTCCGSVLEKRRKSAKNEEKSKKIKPDQLALRRNPKLGCVEFRSRSTVKRNVMQAPTTPNKDTDTLAHTRSRSRTCQCMRDHWMQVSGRPVFTCCCQSHVYLDESITVMQISVGLGRNARDYCPFNKILLLSYRWISFHVPKHRWVNLTQTCPGHISTRHVFLLLTGTNGDFI